MSKEKTIFLDEMLENIARRNGRFELSADKKTRVFKPLTIDELIEHAQKSKGINADPKQGANWKQKLINDLLNAGY